MKVVDKGILIYKTKDTIQFSDLILKDIEITFQDDTHNKKETTFVTNIILIKSASDKIIYQDPSFVLKNEAKKDTLQQNLVDDIAKDGLFKPLYPAGIYVTKEEFINKKPSISTKNIVPKGLIGIKKPVLLSIQHYCYFYNETDEKIRNVFAVSYKGHLYFQIGAILSNRNKTDRAQSNDFPNGFARVITGGNNYFYTEVDLANKWVQGIAYGAVGGAVGVVIARSEIYGKGIVWDFKNQEFNIFKNCNDFNDFITDKYPEGLQECINHQPDMYKVRDAIELIK
jgi:hypothetical protein